MADFVFLYSGGSTPDTEEDQASALKAWTDWFQRLGPAVKDGGNPFGPDVKTLEGDGSIRSGAQGTPHTGYSIVRADSLDAATTIAKGSPILEGGGSVTVYEVVEAM